VQIVRRGRIVRLLGDLDPVGRMARLLVAIDDPFGLRAPGSNGNRENGDPGRRLLLGAYVRVEIEGREEEGLFKVPRVAIRKGDRIWLMGQDEHLTVQQVQVAWREKDAVFVRSGLKAGQRIITSAVGNPDRKPRLRVRDAVQDEKPVLSNGMAP
jgi:hypothetical protein